MNTDELDYVLPLDRIAQEPAPRREDARLLAVDRATGAMRHLAVRDFPSLLSAGDLLVLNDTRVLQARFHATRQTGGRVRLLLLEVPESGPARAMVRCSGHLRSGEILSLAGGEGRLKVIRKGEEDILHVEPGDGRPWKEVMKDSGRPPLPPYIRRPFDPDPRLSSDRERYQTVFATIPGSIAAPTAGMHLTETLVEEIEGRGVNVARVTLHVGPGTFKPVKADRLEEHEMEPEWCRVPPETVRAVERTRSAGRRVNAVGTTVVRALEAASSTGTLRPFEGPADLFIRPPHSFRSTDALLTNFHLPRTTLLALVAAFMGLPAVLSAYREAIRLGYRFYSFGDTCFFR